MLASHLARRGSALLLCCCEAQPQLQWLGRTLLSAAAFTSGSGSSSSAPPPQQPQQPSEQPRSPHAHTPAGGSPQLDTDSLLGGTPSQQQQQRRRLPRDLPSLGDWLRNGGPAAGSGGQLPHQQEEPAAPPQRRVFIETYGCQMNSSDSEIVASVLAAQRYVAAPSAAEAGIVLLNTCAIRENAEARIWGRLGELQAMKRQRRQAKQPPLIVGVLGCMAERLKQRLLDQARLADLVVGPDAYRDLPRILAAVQAGEAEGAAAMNVQLSLDETYSDVTPVRQGANSVSAFVSIMRGCNNMCAFCIVPFTRGRERSRPVDSILCEVEQLAQQGVREVTLLGQNVNSFADLSHQHQQQHAARASSSSPSASSERQYYAPGFSSVVARPRREGAVGFAELLERVARVDPEMRVRYTSPHPKDFTDDVLEVIAALPNVCNHLHMPAQSGSTSCLARMRRGYSRDAYDALVARARAAIPNMALSTDIITGFSGETDAEHAATLDLLRATRFDNAFLFSYSQRDKTHAARHLPDDVPADVKARRLAEAFEAYRAGQAELHAAEVGRVHLVLLDGRPRRGGDTALQGRTCSMKRSIIPEQPLPPSLDHLRQRLDSLQSQHGPGAAAAAATLVAAGGGGPVVSVGSGDYVAVLVTRLAGTGTLLSTPLARTSTAEFVRVFGSTTPGHAHVPGWLAAATGPLLAAADWQQVGEEQQQQDEVVAA